MYIQHSNGYVFQLRHQGIRILPPPRTGLTLNCLASASIRQLPSPAFKLGRESRCDCVTYKVFTHNYYFL